jgi:hypothetical protein
MTPAVCVDDGGALNLDVGVTYYIRDLGGQVLAYYREEAPLGAFFGCYPAHLFRAKEEQQLSLF